MLRFTIRDLLWLVVVGMAVALWMQGKHSAGIQRENRDLRFKNEFIIENAKGIAGLDVYDGQGVIIVSRGSKMELSLIPAK